MCSTAKPIETHSPRLHGLVLASVSKVPHNMDGTPIPTSTQSSAHFNLEFQSGMEQSWCELELAAEALDVADTRV